MSMEIDPIGGENTNEGPLTIDRIGLEHSKRYAQDQATFEQKYVKDSHYVSSQSSIAVSDAAYVPLLNSLMGTQSKASWALIEKPKVAGSLSLFTSTCVPSLGTQDQRDIKIETIRGKLESLEESYLGKESTLPFTERKALTHTIHQSKALLKVFEQIGILDTIKETIFARINQYHRG